MIKRLPLLILVVFLASCSAEMKIARTFVKEPPDINILLTPPDYLYKYTLKPDSVALLTNEVDDSVFLTEYVNSFMDELRNLNFSVYLKGTAEEYLKEKDQVYEVNMAQIQLDEYFYPVVDSADFWDTLYISEIPLNAVDYSSWFEMKKMGREKGIVLFASYRLEDGFEGGFFNEPWTGSVRYRYKIDSLTSLEVQQAGAALGKMYARYLYDFFLNQYIRFNMPGLAEPYYYYHYNRLRDIFIPVEENRFQVVDIEQ